MKSKIILTNKRGETFTARQAAYLWLKKFQQKNRRLASKSYRQKLTA